MANKLKIYMCSGVGAPKDAYKLWLDDTNTTTNTQAVNRLLITINALNVDIDYRDLTKKEYIEHYNQIDVYVIALQFAKKYAGDNDAMERAGRIIQKYINDGKFSSQAVEDDARAANLDMLYNAISSDFTDGKDSKASGEFIAWWMASIIPYNHVGLTRDQITKSREFMHAQGVGAPQKDYGDITQYIYDSGQYFLYLFIPTEQAQKLPLFIREKIKIQRKTYDYVKETFVALYGTEQELQTLIRTNIIEHFKHTPEEAIAKLLKSKGISGAEPISWTIEAVIMLVSLILSIVMSVLQVVLQYCATVEAARYAVPENIEDGCPEGDDWKTTVDGSKLIKFGVIAAIVLLILKRK